jgi:sugar O-acyltransferase (sialic acid O-acetyltransferase NeuD family)
MVIVGAKGMAKELLEILSTERKMSDKDILFFDDINSMPSLLYGRFQILNNIETVEEHFSSYSNKFTLGLGNPASRQRMAEQFTKLGGELTSVLSNTASIGTFNTSIGRGSQIMQGVIITNDVTIGEGVLVNLNTTISHDSYIEDYCEIACGVTIPGRCRIGKNAFIGSRVVLNPDISIGDNSIIGSGSVVIKDVPPSVTVAGNPAKIIRYHG